MFHLQHPQDHKENYQFSSSTFDSDAAKMPLILENGRKVYGPPSNFIGPRPTYKCELYVTKIPQHLDEFRFLMWLHRIGRVYEFRLMMDTGNATRGYAFIRFCSENDALAAFELLKYLFVGQDRLSVFRSQGKNRLFVSGIPRQIPLNLLEDSFKMCFPKMQSCTVYAALKKNKLMMGHELEQNRGFAFIEFDDHEMALEAKKRLTPGRIRMWGVDLKVQWAKPKEELQQLAERYNKNSQIDYGTKIHTNNQRPYLINDYCSKLRLYCLANNLCIPIVLYGPCFRPYQIQYTGLLLKNNYGSYSMYIFEIMLARMSDIHLLMCELAVKMYERNWGQLQQHFLFRVLNDTQAELVLTFQTTEQLNGINMQNIFKSVQSIKGIAKSLELLARQSSKHLLTVYKNSFLTRALLAEFELESENPYGQFYSILPKFRNNCKLNNNFNDMEIVLMQAHHHHMGEDSEYDIFLQNHSIGDHPFRVNNKYVENIFLKSQHGYDIKYLLRYVDLMALQTRECYHRTQRVNNNPMWIAGHTYQDSIYN